MSEFYKRVFAQEATIGVSLGSFTPNQIIKGVSINRTDTRGELTSAIFKENQLNCSCIDSLTNGPDRPIETFSSPYLVVRGYLFGTFTKLSNRISIIEILKLNFKYFRSLITFLFT